MKTATCAHCGQSFPAQLSTARYCSNKCRQAASRARRPRPAPPPCLTCYSARFAGLNIWPPAPIPGSVAHHAGPMPTINATVCTARPYPPPCGVKVIILTAWNLSKNLESFGTAARGLQNGRDLAQKRPFFRWDAIPMVFYLFFFTLGKLLS